MISTSVKPFVALFFLLSVKSASIGQGWETIQIDTLASIDFPVQPKSTNQVGARQFIALDQSGAYIAAVWSTGFPGNTPGDLDSMYKAVMSDITKKGIPGSIYESNFQLDGLRGEDVMYSAIKNDRVVYMHARIFFADENLYLYSYSTGDKSNLFSEPDHKFMNTFRLDTTRALKQLGNSSKPAFANKPRESFIMRLLKNDLFIGSGMTLMAIFLGNFLRNLLFFQRPLIKKLALIPVVVLFLIALYFLLRNKS